jgi:hypothetical protein
MVLCLKARESRSLPSLLSSSEKSFKTYRAQEFKTRQSNLPGFCLLILIVLVVWPLLTVVLIADLVTLPMILTLRMFHLTHLVRAFDIVWFCHADLLVKPIRSGPKSSPGPYESHICHGYARQRTGLWIRHYQTDSTPRLVRQNIDKHLRP